MKIMLEVIPPLRRANAEAVLAAAEKIKAAVKALRSVEYLDVPEITEENYAGMPLYKHTDCCEYASLLHKSTGIEAVANKVTPYEHSEAEFRTWLENSVSAYGIRSFVFVGGNSHTRKYPGPPVLRADEIASNIGNLKIGNICIPSRAQEAERLVLKTQAGCSFLTTQTIFDPMRMGRVIADYASRCETAGIRPASFFISLAPVASQYDIEFFKWLGAEIPEAAEEALRKSPEMALGSVKLAAEIFFSIVSYIRDRGIKVEVAPNVELISNANLDAACKIVDSLDRRLH